MDNGQPKRVAIIGGGCAAISTALELTRPERNGEFDVTIYQMGWRLGGKGASGRDPVHGRIEEHGLHLWMGFYENAFRLMRQCYEELDRPPGHPLQTWQDAFVPDNYVGVTERGLKGQWSNWSAYFPPAAGLPGDPLKETNPFSVRGYMAQCLRLLKTLMLSVSDKGDVPPTGDGTEGVTAAAMSLITQLLSSVQSDMTGTAARAARYGQLAIGALILEAISVLHQILERVAPNTDLGAASLLLGRLTITIRTYLDEMMAHDPEVRRVWEIADTVLAIMRGLIMDGILFSPRGFDAIDDCDWKDWLEKHGASKSTVDSAFIRGCYDLLFAFEDGDVSQPSLAAGQALRGAMRMFFTYRGALFWKMQAGMGDVVFTPAYQVLVQRGVKFEFFHRLERVGLSEDKSHVKTLDFTVQAEIRHGKDYKPLVDVKGLECWPNRPLYDQLLGGEKLEERRWNPEDETDTRKIRARSLQVQTDFDFAVLAVGFGSVPGLCQELIDADARWKKMVDTVKTVPTQAFQVWLDQPVEALGWEHPPINISGYVEPFDTWADMRQLIPRENWKKDPKAIAYFCSVLPDNVPKDVAHETVRQNAVTFLNRDVAHFWPGAVDGDTFRWSLLSGGKGTGESRFDSQFWIANTHGSERYVQSLPGTLEARISPLDDRFFNFTIAGDWTGCGHMAGCVEAAVMSGLLAASAVAGTPRLSQIVGYDHP